MREVWKKAGHRVVESVEVFDVDPITIGRPEKPERFLVGVVDVSTFWVTGQEDEARQVVTLIVRKLRVDGTPANMAGKLYLRQLQDHDRQVPEWLDSIITRATPRGVNVP